MNYRDLLDKAMINQFSYHDGVITKFIEDGYDYLLIFKDGWNEGQVNEIKFSNAKAFYEYDLVGRDIYQLGWIDFYQDGLNNGKFLFEIFVWYKGNLVEVVKLEAQNIITKCYTNNEEETQDLKEFIQKKK